MKFRKKPVEIEAMQWDGSYESQIAIVTWSGGAVSGWFDDEYFLEVETLEGTMRANPGDWIIRGVQGEYYPCKSDIFEATYFSSDDLKHQAREDVESLMDAYEGGCCASCDYREGYVDGFLVAMGEKEL